jgi:N-acetylated-alpha-linked acidic dipeptidase
VKTRIGLALAVVTGVLLAVAWRPTISPPLGFSRATAGAHAALERRFLDVPSTTSIRESHQFLTRTPHVAGSARDRELAEWTRDRFRDFGFDDVNLVTHDVLLPWPIEVVVQMNVPNGPTPWTASMREDPVPRDASTNAGDIGIPYHAYSASGDITAQVVYAGSGNPSDYDWLAARGIDVQGKIALVRYSLPYTYRGYKAFVAQNRGAAGILIYSDPADDGYARGKVYPDGPWGPDSHIQRGSIGYDFLVPGDPLTPGWPSIAGARRIAAREAASLPTIISAPLSHRDARTILEALGGPEVPQEWRGALPITYRAGPGVPMVRMHVRSDDRIRQIWTVTGMMRGSERPDDVVIVGNHRDAWIYGGVDPSSGTAAMIELARGLGELKRHGWRPRRSILLASWDAEEFGLTSSTEWGEQHERWLRGNAVAYLNVDSAASGPDLAITSVPSLNQVIEAVARIVRDPASGLTLAARARDRATLSRPVAPTGAPTDFIDNRLGGGSDYTVFLNFLGVPVADFSFQGPYGVYHSTYDNHQWVANIGDPGFRYHRALVQLWGLVALRLADADVIPLDYVPYAERIEEFTREVRTRWTNAQLSTPDDPLDEVRVAAAEMRSAATAFHERRETALRRPDPEAIRMLNDQLLTVDRALLDPDGLVGRPWYRHLVYAPKFTYAPETLPGIAEAVDSGDFGRARIQAQRLAAALRRAAATLQGPAH